MKTAIVYDRVNKFGGAERVLLTLHEMFPDAPLYTSVYDEKKAPWAKIFPKVNTSFLQNLPILKNHHELIGWLMPIAFESFDFKDYDLVISVTSEAAKGIITLPKTKHICYMLTPTRYLWSGYDKYFKNPVLRFFSKPVVGYLKWWDKVAAQRPDVLISISNEVKNRVKFFYGRNSKVIYPPVDIKNFQFPISNFQSNSNLKIKNYYLYVGRLVKYKKVDLLVNTFNKLGLPLVIVGIGLEAYSLKHMAYSNVKFLGNISDEELVKIYSNARAFMMPQEEDFGIVAVEAQSFGIPVIAYNKGGAMDTVIDGKTGILLDEQNEASLRGAIEKFEKMSFNRKTLMLNAKRFSKENFKSEFRVQINKFGIQL